MTIDVDAIFQYKVLNPAKLPASGFTKRGEAMEKAIPIMQKQFYVLVIIYPDGTLQYKVMETALEEEYVLVNVASAQGGFVAEVRSACEAVLLNIANLCYDTEVLKAEQTKRILAHIRAQYGVEPEFLWEKTPDSAVFRRKDNGKWFAIIMSVDRCKLGLPGHGNIEIMDMKAEPEAVLKLLQQKNYYAAFHMNKKHWFTVCLDGSIADKKFGQLLASSYACVAKK